MAGGFAASVTGRFALRVVVAAAAAAAVAVAVAAAVDAEPLAATRRR